MCVFQFSAHSEFVYIETKEVAPIEEVKLRLLLSWVPSEDDVAHQIYPQAVNAVGSRDTLSWTDLQRLGC